MLCPKCGLEYEGNRCPRHEGPEIIVNNADYLRRKQAYEQKQAGKSESAFLNKEDEKEIVDYTPEYALKKLKELKQNNEKNHEKKSRKKLSGGKPVEMSSDVPDTTKAVVRKKKRVTKLIILLAVVLLLIIAVYGVYRLAIRKNYVLYTSYNGKIYNVSELESKLVCDESKAIFAVDEKTFYTPDIPKEITGNILTSLASDDGDSYALVSYTENDSMYSVYVWNEQTCQLIAKSELKKDIVYVTKEGTVIYKNIDVIDQLQNTGKIELMVYNPIKNDINNGGELVLLSDDIASVNVYSKLGKVVYLTKDKNLCIYKYSSGDSKLVVESGVDNIYVPKETGHYSYDAPVVCSIEGEKGVVYSKEEKMYYHDLNSDTAEDIYVASVNGSGFELIYEKKNVFYIVSSGKLYNGSDMKELLQLSAKQDIMYIPEKHIVLAVNNEGEMVKIKNDTVKVLAKNVEPGSLTSVGNMPSSIVYITNGSLAYRSSVDSSEIILSPMGKYDGIINVIYYKNKLYFYNSEGKICASSLKGKNTDIIGEVERFWLGTKLQ